MSCNITNKIQPYTVDTQNKAIKDKTKVTTK